MKFHVNMTLVDEAVNFANSKEAQRSPLATKVFGFPWAAGVYIGHDFITITKEDWVEWEMLAEPLAGLLLEHFESGDPVLLQYEGGDEKPFEGDAASPGGETKILETDSPIVRQIKTILNEEIRPAVGMDGGDIIFHRYENNRIYIYMRGACAGCPSSTMTLKNGIEARFKELLPEVLEVIAL